MNFAFDRQRVTILSRIFSGAPFERASLCWTTPNFVAGVRSARCGSPERGVGVKKTPSCDARRDGFAKTKRGIAPRLKSVTIFPSYSTP